MFGSILTMSKFDVILSLSLFAILIATYTLFYNRFLLISYDENYAKTSGINVTKYQFLISILTALIIVIGMKLMGTLLISTIIVFPAVTARKITNSFKTLVITSSIISVITFIFGIMISAIFSFPAGASIALIDVIFLLVISIFKKIIIK